MTDDRTLLEKAARAAGIVIDKSETNGGGRGNTGFCDDGRGVYAMLDWHNYIRWAPLQDDGDALRLAIKLGIFVDTNANSASADGRHFMAQAGERDPYAATRRAIVRAAASLSPPDAAGKNQGEQG